MNTEALSYVCTLYEQRLTYPFVEPCMNRAHLTILAALIIVTFAGSDGSPVATTAFAQAAPNSVQTEAGSPMSATCEQVFASSLNLHETAGERALIGLDLNGEDTAFSLLGEIEGTSIIIKVKDADGRNVAVIKTDTSNTSTEGEVFVYRLSKLLGFSDIVAPVVPVQLEAGALVKLRDMLRAERLRDAAKERRRTRLLATIEEAIRNDGTFGGAMKPWLSAFIFDGEHGRRETLARQEVMQYLRARGRQPPVTDTQLSQFTRLYPPVGTHRGTIAMRQLAIDLSDIMLADSLSGQNDRFAGANVHFRAESGEREEVGERRGMPIFELGRVRLLALDNGASVHGRHGSGLADLMGSLTSGTRIERFDRHAINQLRDLGALLLDDYGCEASTLQDAARMALLSELGVYDSRSQEYVAGYLQDTLTYIDGLEARYGERIYFEEAPVPTEELESSGDVESIDDAEPAPTSE